MAHKCSLCFKTFTRKHDLFRHNNGRCLGRPPLPEINANEIISDINSVGMITEINFEEKSTQTTTTTNRKWTIKSSNLKPNKLANDMSLWKTISENKKKDLKDVNKNNKQNTDSEKMTDRVQCESGKKVKNRIINIQMMKNIQILLAKKDIH